MEFFLVRLICTVGILFSACVVPSTAAVKVFLLAGQSNMQGVGAYHGWHPEFPADVPCSPPYDSVQTSVKFWDYGVPTKDIKYNGPDANQPELQGNHWVDLQPTFGYKTGEFGPEVSFGYELTRIFPNDQIYLVKYARGGTTLAYDWNPAGTGTEIGQLGACYNLFRTRVHAALSNLRLAGQEPKIAGMLWLQGEADTRNTTMAEDYRMNLTNFISKVREDFKSPEMLFVLGRINNAYLSQPGGSTVREAQTSVAESLPNVYWFDTDDLQRAYPGHYGTTGQIELGKRFAEPFKIMAERSKSTR